MRVLIAEDEPLVSSTYSRALERAGHEVSAFADGSAALDAYVADPFPIVVTDWKMPKLNGVELCRAIRRRHASPYAHVMFVTSLSTEERMMEAFRAGADDFLGKPCRSAALVGRIAAAERGILAKTEDALRDALDVLQRALGPDHPALLEGLEPLSDLARKQRSYVRCRALLRRQLALADRTLGRDDARTRRIGAELDELVSRDGEP